MLRNATLALALIGCGHARIVSSSPTGGVIELEGDAGRAREEADQAMADHCGLNNFTIAREADEPTSDAVGSTQIRRLHYYCGNAPPIDAAVAD